MFQGKQLVSNEIRSSTSCGKNNCVTLSEAVVAKKKVELKQLQIPPKNIYIYLTKYIYKILIATNISVFFQKQR